MSEARTKLLRALKALYVIAVVVAMAWGLARMDVLGDGRLLGVLLLPQSFGFVIAWCGMVILLGALWRLWLDWRYGVRLPASEWMPAQVLAWAGRYLPGKFGLLLGKLVIARREHLSWREVGASVLVEQLAYVSSGIVVGIALLPEAAVGSLTSLPPLIAYHWDMLRILLVAVVAAAFPVSVRVIDHMHRPAGSKVKPAAGLISTLGLLALYVLPHVLIGSAFWLILCEISDLPVPIGQAVAVLALAHVAGILALFAPAGIGVREAVIAGGLAGLISFPQALLLAVALRLLTLLGDGGLLLLALASRGRRNEAG
ncbi:lysylphosphatidylglycerol synthase domain-containing protein [Marilutibacter maris]|uniref:lysylphosphatidylglycerol synthase domain-containing protein n=1 Tax=Marilutibacter maris TaxID=1605891 RepID=UPI000DA7CCEF|nr:lysylphosphatidylglycerol synthase domain-containing protein [Lysobacter maris]